jgi:hypothetical protein
MRRWNRGLALTPLSARRTTHARPEGRMKKLCPKCGLNIDLVGARHNCRSRPSATSPTKPAPSPTKVKTSPTIELASPTASPTKPKTGAARNYRWREKNRDRYNETMREWRRKRRAGAGACR